MYVNQKLVFDFSGVEQLSSKSRSIYLAQIRIFRFGCHAEVQCTVERAIYVQALWNPFIYREDQVAKPLLLGYMNTRFKELETTC